MPVDYSKWDALELSDDSDIEVHPNVDKRSFIRAKQNQIHQERNHRRYQIATYKYERIINDGFLQRIRALLVALESHKADATTHGPDDLLFRSMMQSVGDPSIDQPPPRPEGVHTAEGELPTYSKMIATLIDQVKETVDKGKETNVFEAYIADVRRHLAKVEDLQQQLNVKLHELEQEDGKRITSESIHTGFNVSSVAKAAYPTSLSQVADSTSKDKVETIEVLNPQVLAPQSTTNDFKARPDQDSPNEAEDQDADEIELTEVGKIFSRFKIGDYHADLEFISKNPAVLAERETDGLLVLAFNSQLEGNDAFSRQCVHQALLLQYCRSLGRDGVGLFFKRITTRGHQAQKVFGDDVNETYSRIKTRAREIRLEREREDVNDGEGVEQIQLHAVDPGTTINITIPPQNSHDPAEQEARRVFDGFNPDLRQALHSGSLDDVNKVLGSMSVEDAESVVAQLGEGGMLSLEEQIIDTTTTEGKEALKRFEEENRHREMKRKGSAETD